MADWFTFSGDLAKFQRELTAMEQKQLPFAVRKAATSIAQDAQKAYMAETARVFKNPTPFTRNAVAVRPSTKDNPEAAVFIKNRAAGKNVAPQVWLRPEIDSGLRDAKKAELKLRAHGLIKPSEYLVIAKDAPVDSHGTLPANVWRKMLSDLDALRSVGSTRKRHTKAKVVYFIPRNSRVRAICLRVGRSFKPIVMIVARDPTYRRRLDWSGLMDRVWKDNAPKRFTEALAFAISTARV